MVSESDRVKQLSHGKAAGGSAAFRAVSLWLTESSVFLRGYASGELGKK